jgi:hypothetical protein
MLALLAALACARERPPPAPAPKPAPPPPLRAWPAPLPGPGLVVGGAADIRAAVPDRCPDHVECVRIANNAADIAAAECDRQCDRCCPHDSVDACAAVCATACTRCPDATCRRAVCSDGWLVRCGERCTVERGACAGCRSAWCAEGGARRGCHADVETHHQAVLAACDRECPEAQKMPDGSTVVRCGPGGAVTASRPAGGCPLGLSADCRCECTSALSGICLAWNAVCVCS